MNTDIIEGIWKEIKEKIQRKWTEFTDDEVNEMKGSQEDLEGALQKKYGFTKEEAGKHLQSFVDEHNQGNDSKV